MKPEREREPFGQIRDGFEISERRACGLIRFAKSSHRYESVKRDDTVLRMRLRELAASRRRFGYRRLWVLLRREGWRANHQRFYRLYCEEGLAVRTKKRRKRPSPVRLVLPPAEGPNERWSMDSVTDRLENGRQFRVLTVVDHFSRECPLLEAGVSMTGESVARALKLLSFDHPLPKVITVDKGSEFFSRAMDSWAYRHGVQLEFMRPGRPVENASVESLNGRFRDECLNGNLFYSIEDARRAFEAWRVDCNTVRPHSSLGDRSLRELLEDHHREATERPTLNLQVVQNSV